MKIDTNHHNFDSNDRVWSMLSKMAGCCTKTYYWH